MQPPDTDPTGPANPAEPVARDADRVEVASDPTAHRVSTAFDPATGERLKRSLKVVVVCLVVAFAVVRGVRFFDSYGLAKAADVATAAPALVDVVEARPVQAAQDLTLPGQTAAWYTSTIYGRVNGYVARWVADIGDHVHKGQLLATIDTPELDAELLAARAQLQVAEADVLARTSDAEFARTTHERWRDSPAGVVSDQEREQKRADFDSGVARLKAAEAQVALDKAKVDQYTALSEFKKVVAPFSGVVTERHIDIGNLVTAGSTSATTPLYQMTQNDPIRVFVDVPQNIAAELMRPSQQVEIHTEAPETLTVTAKVARAAGAINAQARTMRLEIDVPNDQQRLLPGMYVKVAFHLAPKGLVQVPAAALIFRSDGPQVARVDGNGKVTFRKVVIARDDGSMIELATGVAPGERLALNVSSQIKDGDVVKVNQGPAGAAAAATGR
jgi:RND family efflux transporter MFP subunit